MATITAQPRLLDCAQSERGRLERVNYFPRQLLTADDMIADQEYFRQRLRRHNRFLHGWGTVCGLEVTAAPTDDAPWRVKIGSGYALGPFGDEIYVGEASALDLARCIEQASSDPCEPNPLGNPGGEAGTRLYVAIRYAECMASPVRAMPSGCGCEEVACEYSRIRDGFEICCLTELPPSHVPPLICNLIAQKKLPPCPPCPEDPWVVLAQVDLPASSGIEVENNMINNIVVRRQIYSTAMLQEQLIRCCCQERDVPQPVPVRVVSVSPANGESFTNEGPVVIEVKFNKDLQEGTVDEQTLTVERDGEKVGGTVKYLAAARTAIFEPKAPLRTGDYKITAHGSGDPHITDLDDLALDGNKDGVGGDDFASAFSVSKLE